MVRNKGMLTERNLSIAAQVQALADESGFSASQVALAWTLRNPAVTAPLLAHVRWRNWKIIWGH